LIAYTQTQSTSGTIDPLTHLADKKIFLYRGESDTTYNKGTVNTTANFFTSLMPHANILFHTTTDSPHLMPGINPYLCWWEEWGGPDNCTFDGAKAVLSWVHGDAALAGGRDNDTEALAAMLQPFDQTKYFPSNGFSGYLADEGKIFIPKSCVAVGSASGSAGRAGNAGSAGVVGGGEEGVIQCKLHFFFHGCDVTDSYDVFTNYTGLVSFAHHNHLPSNQPHRLVMHRAGTSLSTAAASARGMMEPLFQLQLRLLEE
jgi:hypothetical protein